MYGPVNAVDLCCRCRPVQPDDVALDYAATAGWSGYAGVVNVLVSEVGHSALSRLLVLIPPA